MQCPHCGAEMEVPNNVFLNVTGYNRVAHIAAPCCGMPLSVSPILRVKVEKSYTERTEDDWGTPYAKPKLDKGTFTVSIIHVPHKHVYKVPAKTPHDAMRLAFVRHFYKSDDVSLIKEAHHREHTDIDGVVRDVYSVQGHGLAAEYTVWVRK